MLDKDEINKEEEQLRNQISSLSEEERKNFYLEVKDKIKDPDTYATLNWFFVAGLHHFYLEKWINACINLLVFIIGIILIIEGDYKIGLGMIILISIVELWALFRSQIIIKDVNNKIYRNILAKIK
ncbi:MAG: hypothetical protein ACNI25_10410 [Halarcobacter sp.]